MGHCIAEPSTTAIDKQLLFFDESNAVTVQIGSFILLFWFSIYSIQIASVCMRKSKLSTLEEEKYITLWLDNYVPKKKKKRIENCKGIVIVFTKHLP